MEKTLEVNVFDSGNSLVSNQKDRFERKLPPAVVEEIFE